MERASVKITGKVSGIGQMSGSLAGTGRISGSLDAIGSVQTVYDGDYVVDPRFVSQTLETQGKVMRDDVTVNSIEVARTSNPQGGKTVYIGGII